MKLELIKTADVYADENNPRQTFDGIEALAESFDLNEERPGEPFIPPIVVRDGGIYRVVDGERRLRALKLRKADAFHANVCETMDEANAMVAMVATDDKQPLTEAEKSRGVQQMLLLGVDPVAVDKGARLEAGTGKRVRAALQAIDDNTAAEDMSLDWLLAIEECDHEPTRERLIQATAATWPGIYAEYLRKAANAEAFAAFGQILTEAGVPLWAEEGMPGGEWEWYDSISDPDQLRKILADDDLPEKMLARFTDYGHANVTLYAKRAEKVADPEELERNRKRNELTEQANAHEARLFKWFEGMRRQGGQAISTKRATLEAALDVFSNDLDYYADSAEVDEVKGDTDERLFAVGFYRMYADPSAFSRVILDGHPLSMWNYERARKWLTLYVCACADGYQPEEYEKNIAAEIDKAVNDYEADHEEEADDDE